MAETEKRDKPFSYVLGAKRGVQRSRDELKECLKIAEEGDEKEEVRELFQLSQLLGERLDNFSMRLEGAHVDKPEPLFEELRLKFGPPAESSEVSPDTD